MKMYLLFSHKLTQEQSDDAKRLGVSEFVSLPKELQNKFSNVPPELESIGEYIKPIKEFLEQNLTSKDIVLIQGDFGVVCEIVKFCKEKGVKAVYATTKRVVKEMEKDGKKVKISEFKHIIFREY
jgi:superfamily I DNA and RNA helicase